MKMKKKPCSFACLESQDGDTYHVWLTSLIRSELKDFDSFKQDTYIRSNGLRRTRDDSKSYFHFDIVKK